MSFTYENKTFGENGGIYISSTAKTDAPYGKSFHAVMVIADAVFSAIDDNIAGDFTTVTFPAGTVLYGIITSFTLTSGKVIAYYNK
jgi:hypothetical protein